MKRFRFFRQKNGEKETTNGVAYKFVERELTANEQWVEETLKECADVKKKILEFHAPWGTVNALFVYCEGLCDNERIDQVVIPSLKDWLQQQRAETWSEDVLFHTWNISSLKRESLLEPLIPRLFSGELVLFFDGLGSAFTLDLSHPPQRSPEDSNTEISIRGARDCFVEEITVNVALLRKRLRTASLVYEAYTIGEKSPTRVALLYMKDIINPTVLEEIQSRLSRIKTDMLVSSNELEEMLSETPAPLLPVFDYTGRPDFAAAALLRGRFIILVDGSPTAICAPVNLLMQTRSPEDFHFWYAFVSYQRFFRMVGLVISIFLPGFFVAVTTYHQDQIPLTLLATLVTSRRGVPFPSALEALLMLVSFELFMEAGLRMPNKVGQTLGVLGALIIGDAAIRSALSSPAMLVVIGITAVASFSLINQSLTGTVSLLRMVVLVVSSILGVFGFLLSLFAIIMYMSNLRSFGLPYLAPMSPVSFRGLLSGLIRIPMQKVNKRPDILRPSDDTRQGGKG